VSDQPKKLIEVALPLDEINAACKADKDRKTGTIRNLHKWFAPMPLPAWRALLYASLIDDPIGDERRAYHLDVIKRLVANGADLPDEDVLQEARANIREAYPQGPPELLDPFCGGGSTLLEAQRLGLTTVGSDLNPVPVLISRTLTELLPKLHGQDPLNWPSDDLTRPLEQTSLVDQASIRTWSGLDGLAIDVEHYAAAVRALAWERLKSYYPSAPGETPIAWHWARTAACPNPACGATTVLSASWWLSKKSGERAWVEPRVVDGKVELEVVSRQESGEAPPAPKAGRGASFTCLVCGQLIEEREVIRQGVEVGLGLSLIAITAQVDGVRTFRSPTAEDLAALDAVSVPAGIAEISLGPVQRYVSPPRFGLLNQADLYTPRQLLAMATFAEAVAGVWQQVLDDGGSLERANAVTALLALAVGKLAQYGSSQAMITTPADGPTRFNSGFGRNDLLMTWDFFEQNFFGLVGGNCDQVVHTALQASRYATNGSGVGVKSDA